ncbi:hypothetical protein AB6C74_10560 [Vibrio splendidus]
MVQEHLNPAFNSIYATAERDGYLGASTLINQLLDAAFDFCDGKSDEVVAATKSYVDNFFINNGLQYHYGSPASFEDSMKHCHYKKYLQPESDKKTQ